MTHTGRWCPAVPSDSAGAWCPALGSRNQVIYLQTVHQHWCDVIGRGWLLVGRKAVFCVGGACWEYSMASSVWWIWYWGVQRNVFPPMCIFLFPGLGPFFLPAYSAAAAVLLLLGLVTVAKILKKRAKSGDPPRSVQFLQLRK